MKPTIFLPAEAMSYKEQRKTGELVTKFRIIRDVLSRKHSKAAVARKYDMGRNTVGNIIKAFHEHLTPEIQEQVLTPSKTFSVADIEALLAPLKNQSTRPKGNKRCATAKQEEVLLDYFHTQGLSVGVDRMWNFLKRRGAKKVKEPPGQDQDPLSPEALSKAKLRGVYKRHGLKVKKVRSKNKNVRPLYDYEALACFERLHYDTKTIPDQKALPEAIYKKFKLKKSLPIIEWNIIDAKSRFRFMAYSHEKSSEFGLHFLLLVLQFIRAHTLCPEMRIIIGTDGGAEFFSGSLRKQAEWNQILEVLNAEIYAYEPHFDVRKNLIERSHKTDDEEFFIPRGEFITGKKTFLKEAKDYTHYFNSLRSHSGIGMEGKTPVEKLLDSGIYNANRFLSFPTMILEDHIGPIKASTQMIRLVSFLRSQERSFSNLLNDPRFCSNLEANFRNPPISAQNVLTEYP